MGQGWALCARLGTPERRWPWGSWSLGSSSLWQAPMELWLPQGCALGEHICTKFEEFCDLLGVGSSLGKVYPTEGAFSGQLNPSSFHLGWPSG